MAEHTIREALLAMNYRECQPGKWAKPVGHQLLTYSEKTKCLENWFLNTNGEVSCWNRERVVKKYPYLTQLKDFECNTRLNIHMEYRPSHFELPAIDLDL